MIIQLGNGLLRVVLEPQFQFETTSRLFTIQASDYQTLESLRLDDYGDMRLDPGNKFFPYTVQAYPEQFQDYVPGLSDSDLQDMVCEDFSPSPKAFRWIRWFDHRPDLDWQDRWGKYMVGHCFPEEVNKTRWLHCLADDKFYVFPLAHFPKDFDDIWICEDDEISSG